MGDYSVTEGCLTISIADVSPDVERRGWDVTWTVTDGANVWVHDAPISTPSGATRDQVIGTAAGFLSAWCESVDYQARTGRESENSDLFSWDDPGAHEHIASLVADDASTLAYQLEED